MQCQINRWMLALVGFDDGTDDSDSGPGVELHSVAEDAVALCDNIESALNEITDRFVIPSLTYFSIDAFAQCGPPIRYQDTPTDRQSYHLYLPVHAIQSGVHIQVEPSI
jgi:hypothetical protein